ncbi:MAG TPA: universal stress protein [Syntrophomonadaceae bacterium]|nr:universal stress protein [Syntrophomonadaceae bacterium]HPR94317.1 universal stress protein [Syntrophomonadaceae bacterium]
MFKKFLVPVDGSPSSKMAYGKAVELAKITDAEIVLLQVAWDIEYYSRKGVLFAGKYFDEDETRSHSAKILAETRQDIDEGAVKISELVLLGDPVRKIIEEEGKPGYDLIVMGSRGNGPIKGAVLGSVSQKVLAGGNLPVLIVKDPHGNTRDDESGITVFWK